MEDQERLTEALADRYRIERENGSGGMAMKVRGVSRDGQMRRKTSLIRASRAFSFPKRSHYSPPTRMLF